MDLVVQWSSAVSNGLGVGRKLPSSATDFTCNLGWFTSAISLSLQSLAEPLVSQSKV